MNATGPFARITGTVLATVFLAIVLILAVTNAFRTRGELAATFAQQARIHQAQLTLEELLRLQIDEESSVRGYTGTKDPFYKQQYHAAVTQFESKEASLRRALRDAGLTSTLGRFTDYDASQEEWRNVVALPMLANPNKPQASIDKRSKFYSDYQARVAQGVRLDLAAKNRELVVDTLEQVNRTLYVSAFWFLVFGLLAILFNAYRSRLNRQLEEERTTTEILQRAFRSVHVPLPGCEIGSAYSSASSHVAVGGDVFDMYRLSEALSLIVIADVSGKGVDAAVLTAFIKFTIRSIALRRRDPGAILKEFNTAFAHTVDNPYLFVSMFVGVFDTDAMSLQYASAGHDSAFVRRSLGVQQLAVTGPVLGVMEEPFGTRTVRLARDDMVVLATDGLTEARNRRGELLREEGAMRLIASGSRDAQQLADGLAAQVKALGGNRMRDDLAILTIRVLKAEDDAQEQADAG